VRIHNRHNFAKKDIIYHKGIEHLGNESFADTGY